MQQASLLPPPTAQAPGTPGGPAPGAPVIVQVTPSPTADPAAVYDAARYLRRELESQLDRLKDERFSIAQRLRSTSPELAPGPDRSGLEQRISQLDTRIAAVDKQIADADASVAKAASVPGAIVERPDPPQTGPPEEAFVLGGLFIFVVLLPLTIAYARRIWRRAGTIASLPQEMYDRFTRIEQSIDSVAIEVERVGESQRFLTRMQAQQQERALSAGPAERLETAVREPERRARN